MRRRPSIGPNAGETYAANPRKRRTRIRRSCPIPEQSVGEKGARQVPHLGNEKGRASKGREPTGVSYSRATPTPGEDPGAARYRPSSLLHSTLHPLALEPPKFPRALALSGSLDWDARRCQRFLGHGSAEGCSERKSRIAAITRPSCPSRFASLQKQRARVGGQRMDTRFELLPPFASIFLAGPRPRTSSLLADPWPMRK
ncbi:hypothetical protein KM043_007302 [Ampulex compressa]|nr:hypothetical protein KM043_007302 [Ampulex compressa]